MKNATAKNDVQVIRKELEEYIGNRKAVKAAEEISAVMQGETQHTHQGEVFYIHKDEDGALVLTMESTAKSKVEVILKSYLEKDEVQECLELIMAVHPMTETKATARTEEFETISVEGSDSSIYVKLLEYEIRYKEEEKFKNLLMDAIFSSVQGFKVPVCDPSIAPNGRLQFVSGFRPAVGYTYWELEELAKISNLRLGNRFEYVLFLGTLINNLIAEGWSEAEAWKVVCVDSKELGHYWWNPENAKDDFEPTGSGKHAGKCDIANTYKILAKEEKACGFWKAGLSKLTCFRLYRGYGHRHRDSVGWFVL